MKFNLIISSLVEFIALSKISVTARAGKIFEKWDPTIFLYNFVDEVSMHSFEGLMKVGFRIGQCCFYFNKLDRCYRNCKRLGCSSKKAGYRGSADVANGGISDQNDVSCCHVG